MRPLSPSIVLFPVRVSGLKVGTRRRRIPRESPPEHNNFVRFSTWTPPLLQRSDIRPRVADFQVGGQSTVGAPTVHGTDADPDPLDLPTGPPNLPTCLQCPRLLASNPSLGQSFEGCSSVDVFRRASIQVRSAQFCGKCRKPPDPPTARCGGEDRSLQSLHGSGAGDARRRSGEFQRALVPSARRAGAAKAAVSRALPCPREGADPHRRQMPRRSRTPSGAARLELCRSRWGLGPQFAGMRPQARRREYAPPALSPLPVLT